jgi:hypothetical protein
MDLTKNKTWISTIEEALTSDNCIMSFDLLIKMKSQENRKLKFSKGLGYSIILLYAPTTSSYAAQGGGPS